MQGKLRPILTLHRWTQFVFIALTIHKYRTAVILGLI